MIQTGQTGWCANGCAAFQPNWLAGEQAGRNLNFNNGRGKPLYLWRNSPKRQYMLGTHWLEIALLEESLECKLSGNGKPDDHELPTHPSWKKRAEACWTTLVRALPAVWGKGSFSLQHWWGLIWSIMSSSGLPSTKEIWFTGVSPVQWGLK